MERVDAGDGTPGEKYFTGQTSRNCQGEQYSSKYQPTVVDGLHEIDDNDADDSFANDDLGDSDVEAVLDDARRFLGDISAGHESHPSGAANTELDPNASVPASCLADDDDRHALPIKEQIDISEAFSEKGSHELRRKRRLSSTVGPQSPPTIQESQGPPSQWREPNGISPSQPR
ncbi:hypothetical protein N7539_008756 [Penicillium diatomitis]|uniref:Uncharacterized protein n=1 Tax=Penicillium diatomitis TaxID=2819901 RepID=A0A9W9WR56_9EURO|nr:uncharacterized protein N7539_008756 [Penicillium diatomitis]KAJ5471813.1 hypothetical protein N7539_008756 [Penicillium diatomitis]